MRILLLLAALFWGLSNAVAQSASERKITEQQRVVERLQGQIAQGEREIASLKRGRASAEQQVRALARQIEVRNDLLAESEKQEGLLWDEVVRTDSLVGELSVSLVRSRERYAGMVREAYRSYRQNGYLTYLFASKSFMDAARRIANLRGMASLRARQIRLIDSLGRCAAEQRILLERRRQTLDSVRGALQEQRRRLKSDEEEARGNIRQLTRREQEALRRKVEREQQLDVAIAELRKLTKGNREGASFSARTSNLRLPVEGGKVKKYKGNMAEITGPRGARILSIYEGKVVDIKRNRITNKYDVYVAHGEYITSYANLSSVTVAKDDRVARNQPLGIIGSSMDVLTMKSEYKLVFGIYPPSPRQTMLAADCFKK